MKSCYLPPAGEATPLCAFTAVLEKLPVTGYDDTNEPKQLAKPNAISSWLASTRYLFLRENALAIAILSRKPMRGTMTRPGPRSESTSAGPIVRLPAWMVNDGA